jgi:hypothetical protein
MVAATTDFVVKFDVLGESYVLPNIEAIAFVKNLCLTRNVASLVFQDIVGTHVSIEGSKVGHSMIHLKSFYNYEQFLGMLTFEGSQRDWGEHMKQYMPTPRNVRQKTGSSDEPGEFIFC